MLSKFHHPRTLTHVLCPSGSPLKWEGHFAVMVYGFREAGLTHALDMFVTHLLGKLYFLWNMLRLSRSEGHAHDELFNLTFHGYSPHCPGCEFAQYGLGHAKLIAIWSHDGYTDSNHQRRDYLFKGLFMMTSSNGSSSNRWPVNSPHKGPVTRSLDILFDLNLNKRLSKQ